MVDILHQRRRRVVMLGMPAALATSILDERAAAQPRQARASRPDHAAFAQRALAMRELAQTSGDQPYGAAIVRDGSIVVEAPSRAVLDGDPTAHAEMQAIRPAANQLNSRNLGGCVMYSSARPCPMCEAAAYWAGIERMYHDGTATDAGAPTLCG
jgi:tRNA(Arg) A34 adenosine deaminase TadA